MCEFERACKTVRSGNFAATDEQRLMLYALYKIASTGLQHPVDEEPSYFDGVGRAKWSAWRDFGATYNQAQARNLYARLVLKLAAS